MNRSFLLSQNSFFQALPFIILGMLAFYFSYHLITGERSIVSSYSLDQKIELAQAEYDQLRVQRIEIEDRVIRLRPNSLDLDYVEERAQYMLGLGQIDDIAIKK